MDEYLDFINNTHSLYDLYYDEWQLCYRSWVGGRLYKDAKYLRAYQVDINTPGETISTYQVGDDGSVVGKSKAKLEYGHSSEEVNRGEDILSGSFYAEKVANTPWYNYVKLIVSEYNSILWRNPPTRELGDSPEMTEFLNNVNGEHDSINEFMSMVDQLSTVYGVIHVECIKPIGSDIPKWKIHKPTDVTNWSYRYDIDGNLILDSVVIKLEESENHSVYRHYTAEKIETIFMGAEDNDDYEPPVDDPLLEQIDESILCCQNIL